MEPVRVTSAENLKGFPLLDDFDIIRQTKNVLENGTWFDNRQILEKYVTYVVGPQGSNNNFKLYRSLAVVLRGLMAKVRKYDLIIAPGDAPSKYVKAMQLVDMYSATFIQFPITLPLEVTDEQQDIVNLYISTMLSARKVQRCSVAILYHAYETKTIEVIAKAVRSYFEDERVPIDVINIPQDLADRELHDVYQRMFLKVDDFNLRIIPELEVDLIAYDSPYNCSLRMSIPCEVITKLMAIYSTPSPRVFTEFKLNVPIMTVREGFYIADVYEHTTDTVLSCVIKVFANDTLSIVAKTNEKYVLAKLDYFSGYFSTYSILSIQRSLGESRIAALKLK